MSGVFHAAILVMLTCQVGIVKGQRPRQGDFDYWCSSTDRCIYAGFECDGDNDCGDDSDERFCLSKESERLTAQSGVIKSPNYPANYRSNTQYTWIIQGSERKLIYIIFTDFHLEDEIANKCSDWVEIKERKTYDSESVRCGKLDDHRYLSSGNYIWMQFRSGSSTVRPGFRMEYEIVDRTTCINKFECSNSTCIPLHFTCDDENDCGDNSDEQLQCLTRECTTDEFLCTVPSNRRCIGKFERCDDSIDCADGADEINCQGTPMTCGGQMKELSGVISSPNYPQPYPNDANCTWTILGANGTVIRLIFTSFSLQEPYFKTNKIICLDNFKILESESEIADDNNLFFCGTKALPYTSSGNYLRLQFVSDSSIVDMGFRLEYSIGQKCGQYNGCFNGGNCVRSRCVCSLGYEGNSCLEDIDECARNPCSNDGTCGDMIGGFTCICPDQFEGTQCEIAKLVAKVVVPSTISVEEDFDRDLLEPASSKYISMAEDFETRMDSMLQERFADAFDKSEVTGFRNGSVMTVIIDFEVHLSLLVGKADDISILAKDAVIGLRDAVAAGIEGGRLGSFIIQPDSFAAFGVCDLQQFQALTAGINVTLACNEGYELIGDATGSICNNEGLMRSSPLPECVKILVCDLQHLVVNIKNGSPIVDESQALRAGTKASVACNEGYQLSGGYPNETICMHGVRWSYPRPKCVKAEKLVKGGSMKLGASFGGVIALVVIISLVF